MAAAVNSTRAPFTLLLSFFATLHHLQANGHHAHGSNQTSPPAIIVFGDSIVDPGNNNAILTTVKCNFPPYGKDFVGHQATGRFSNGKIPSDLIGNLPAYLGTVLSDSDLITGVSFASGGSTEIVSLGGKKDQCCGCSSHRLFTITENSCRRNRKNM